MPPPHPARKQVKSLVKIFKDPKTATLLASSSTPDSFPRFNLPEVVVAGRANVGKSTFLNALMGRTDLVETSKKAGRTRKLDFFGVGRKLILVDAPGYGARGRADWGELWDHYIDTRRELRGILLLINAPHGVTEFDRAMLENLNQRLTTRFAASSESKYRREKPPILQPIFTKVDSLKGDEKDHLRLIKEVKTHAPIAATPIWTAVVPKLGVHLGIAAARIEIARICSRR